MKLCSICARGGSKGLENKNIKPLLGKPLICHTIEQAIESKEFNAIAVSSDSDEILNIAAKYNHIHLIKRPDELASDTAGKVPAILHALTVMENKLSCDIDIMVDMDVTSPLRGIADIKGAIAMLEKNKTSNVITGVHARRSPYFNLVEQYGKYVRLAKEMDGDAILRRQDAPPCYDMNASIYVWDAKKFARDPKIFYNDTLLYIMDISNSYDIDCALDFAIVEMILQKRLKKK